MMLIVSPNALNKSKEVMMDKGMEMQIINVLRQLPRNSRIMIEVSDAAMIPSRTTPLSEARTKTDWSASGCIWSSGGRVAAMPGSAARMPFTIVSVEAAPAFSIVSRTPR